jgi:Protein of unknown function (DUF1214)
MMSVEIAPETVDTESPNGSWKTRTRISCPHAQPQRAHDVLLLRHRRYSGDGGGNSRSWVAVCCGVCRFRGKPLDGSKTYRIHLPPNIPAKNFWSFVIYDNQTRSMLQTDEQFPSIGSQKKELSRGKQKLATRRRNP